MSRNINVEIIDLRNKKTGEYTRADLQRAAEIARKSGRMSDKLFYVSVKHALEDNEVAKNDTD